ncbi:MAG: Nitroreductase [candidate division TM6 bacterium GW2011_GWF2_32_72]|nr:MAG: Nitroreductase [candidate division TM6 bacterium GW2011_GWF2_32_72]
MVKRVAPFKVADLFINRWSPRAMSGESITDFELMSLFEAARWAPSSYNNQPWRFIYAKRDSKNWSKFFDLLVDFNKQWAKNAAALVLLISRKKFEYNDKPSRTHELDAGAASENFSLQGFLNGLVVHGMEGFDYDKSREVLGIPEDYTILAMYAVGKPGKKEDLSKELQEREEMSDRKKIEEFVFEGNFKK